MRRSLIIAPALLLLTLAGCAVPKPDTMAAAGTSSSAAAGVEADSDQPAAARKPKPADYRVTVKTITKQCFGSAGCNVTARLKLSGLTEAAMSTPAELTVKVKGGSDGAAVETITLDGEGQYDAPELYLSTPSSARKITASVSSVETN